MSGCILEQCLGVTRTVCMQVQGTREVMQRQLNYIRDGHYIDSHTAEIMACLVANASDGTTFSVVEIRAKKLETGGFSQTAHVWSVQAPKANMSKWQLAQWLGAHMAPIAFLLANALHFLVVLLPAQVIQQALLWQCVCAFVFAGGVLCFGGGFYQNSIIFNEHSNRTAGQPMRTCCSCAILFPAYIILPESKSGQPYAARFKNVERKCLRSVTGAGNGNTHLSVRCAISSQKKCPLLVTFRSCCQNFSSIGKGGNFQIVPTLHIAWQGAMPIDGAPLSRAS
jgi:hypothetical protein